MYYKKWSVELAEYSKFRSIYPFIMCKILFGDIVFIISEGYKGGISHIFKM